MVKLERTMQHRFQKTANNKKQRCMRPVWPMTSHHSCDLFDSFLYQMNISDNELCSNTEFQKSQNLNLLLIKLKYAFYLTTACRVSWLKQQ